MLKFRTVLLIALLPLIVNGMNVAACDTATQKKAAPNAASSSPPPQSKNKKGVPEANAPAPRGTEKNVNNDLKILAEGGFSRVADAVLIVARDADVYAALRAEAAPNLPEMSADFFKSNAVVAAFLGTRRTGGYAVEISRVANDAVRVSATSPEGGGMSTQVISAPYKIVIVPLARADANLSLEVEDVWKSSMRPYRVDEGKFTMSGGIAGRGETFGFGGELRVMRFGKLATFALALKNSDGAKPRALSSVATGLVAGDGKFKFAPLDANSFVDNPNSALSATGQFANGENSFALTFTSLPSNVSDGYSGGGTLKAVATAPAPPKRKPALIDEM
jgi:hypothetical protein